MSLLEFAALMQAIGTVVAAIASIIAVGMAVRTQRKVELVHLATNGMKDELVKVTGEAKFAEGFTQGEKSQPVKG